MPHEEGDLNLDSAVESFLADDGNDSDAGDEATAQTAEREAAASDDGEAEDSSGADDAADDAEASDDGAEAKDEAGEEKGEKEDREPTALEKAIEAGDVRKFIEALGDKAEALLGGKAHKALRLAAGELSKQESRLKKAGEALKAKFGDPAEARKKWEAGDLDAFVDIVEKMTGVPWADARKAVDDSIAGRETRLQAKAKADEEAKAKAEATRAEHEKSLKSLITDTVKGSDAKLLEADPEIVDDLFRIMQTGWKKGINTPAKALAVLKKRLTAVSAVLAPKPPAPKRAPAPRPRGQIPPPRVPQTRGEQSDDWEVRVDQFLREEGYHGR